MSQVKKIKSYLEEGNKITPLEALNQFGSLRLGAIIHILRREGMNIKTNYITVENKTFAEYELIAEPQQSFLEGEKMTDRLFSEIELEEESNKVDLTKEQAMARYKPQLDSMDILIKGLDQYQLKFGTESNVYYEVLELKMKLVKNKEALEQFLGDI